MEEGVWLVRNLVAATNEPLRLHGTEEEARLVQREEDRAEQARIARAKAKRAAEERERRAAAYREAKAVADELIVEVIGNKTRGVGLALKIAHDAKQAEWSVAMKGRGKVWKDQNRPLFFPVHWCAQLDGEPEPEPEAAPEPEKEVFIEADLTQYAITPWGAQEEQREAEEARAEALLRASFAYGRLNTPEDLEQARALVRSQYEVRLVAEGVREAGLEAEAAVRRDVIVEEGKGLSMLAMAFSIFCLQLRLEACGCYTRAAAGQGGTAAGATSSGCGGGNAKSMVVLLQLSMGTAEALVRAVRAAATGGTEPEPAPPAPDALSPKSGASKLRIKGALSRAKVAAKTMGTMAASKAARAIPPLTGPGGLQGMRALQLKKELAKRRLRTEGDRAELIKRLQDFAAGLIDPAPAIEGGGEQSPLEPLIDCRPVVIEALVRGAAKVKEDAEPNFQFKLQQWRRVTKIIRATKAGGGKDKKGGAVLLSTAQALSKLRKGGEAFPGENPDVPKGHILRAIKTAIDTKLSALQTRKQELETDLLEGWAVVVHSLEVPPPKFKGDPPQQPEEVWYWRVDEQGRARAGSKQAARPFLRTLKTVTTGSAAGI